MIEKSYEEDEVLVDIYSIEEYNESLDVDGLLSLIFKVYEEARFPLNTANKEKVIIELMKIAYTIWDDTNAYGYGNYDEFFDYLYQTFVSPLKNKIEKYFKDGVI